MWLQTDTVRVRMSWAGTDGTRDQSSVGGWFMTIAPSQEDARQEPVGFIL
jgi:hypothetical protein